MPSHLHTECMHWLRISVRRVLMVLFWLFSNMQISFFSQRQRGMKRSRNLEARPFYLETLKNKWIKPYTHSLFRKSREAHDFSWCLWAYLYVAQSVNIFGGDRSQTTECRDQKCWQNGSSFRRALSTTCLHEVTPGLPSHARWLLWQACHFLIILLLFYLCSA